MRIDTTLGPMTLTASDAGLTRCLFGEQQEDHNRQHKNTEILDLAHQQLDEYFAGTRTTFTVPVAPTGRSTFDIEIADALDEHVPYGTTVSYGKLTALLGRPPVDARKVGAGLGRNPVAIIVPCHRVVGADGSLTGYAGGLHIKRQLLDLESQESTLDLLMPR